MQYKSGNFVYENKADYERAQKEEEIIRFLKADKKIKKPSEALKMYNAFLMKKTFTTAAGYVFMSELRKYIISSGIMDEKGLNPIPVFQKKQDEAEKGSSKESKEIKETKEERKERKDSEKYQLLYERERNFRVKNYIVIAFLTVAVGIMLALSYMGFLSGTNRSEDTELENRYVVWQEELNEKERKLNERQEELEKQIKEQNIR